jgi:hypothetical protein
MSGRAKTITGGLEMKVPGSTDIHRAYQSEIDMLKGVASTVMMIGSHL